MIRCIVKKLALRLKDLQNQITLKFDMSDLHGRYMNCNSKKNSYEKLVNSERMDPPLWDLGFWLVAWCLTRFSARRYVSKEPFFTHFKLLDENQLIICCFCLFDRWGYDKFPKETPLVFYKGGKPILPPLGMLDGFKNVLESMISYIESEVPSDTLKFWRLQSPRHFYGGNWNQNGSCLFDEPLEENQVRFDNSFLMIFGITVVLNLFFLYLLVCSTVTLNYFFLL